jgi:hypothetical protein
MLSVHVKKNNRILPLCQELWRELSLILTTYRRRAAVSDPLGFEVNPPLVGFGEECYCAVPHRELKATRITDPLSNATLWDLLQTGVYPLGESSDPHRETLWSPRILRRIQARRYGRFA